MKKVGEHVTIDFLGVKKDYTPDFAAKPMTGADDVPYRI